MPWICLAASLGIGSSSWAGSWTCQHTGLTRQVTVFYPEAPAPLPCKVYYSKPDENVLPRVLWKAGNQQGYCERKAEQLAEKLRSLGWQCSNDAQ